MLGEPFVEEVVLVGQLADLNGSAVWQDRAPAGQIDGCPQADGADQRVPPSVVSAGRAPTAAAAKATLPRSFRRAPSFSCQAAQASKVPAARAYWRGAEGE